MSSQFQVDTQQIEAASADIRRLSGDIDSMVAQMAGRLSSLDAAWRGAAATGFKHATSSWTATQRQVRASLDEIQVALSRAGRQYAEVEAANASLFRG